MANLNENLQSMLEPVLKKEILDGILLKNITLTTGVLNHVSHKLQRPVIGYFVVRADASSNVWDSEDDNLNRDVFLDLRCSANVTVSLWVF